MLVCLETNRPSGLRSLRVHGSLNNPLLSFIVSPTSMCWATAQSVWEHLPSTGVYLSRMLLAIRPTDAGVPSDLAQLGQVTSDMLSQELSDELAPCVLVTRTVMLELTMAVCSLSASTRVVGCGW